MKTKIINNNEFREAIRVAFTSDKDIISLYCPHVKVENVEDIVNDISKRIGENGGNPIIKGVFEKGELIGYYVYEGRTLISFALNVKYRVRKYLNNLFSLFRNDLKGSWQCFLWSRNIRGIKYLTKHGMKIGNSDNLITHLIF